MKFNVLIILMTIFVALGSVGAAKSQECGPGCPACSGKAVGDLLSPMTVLFSGLYIPEGEEEKAIFNLRYGLFSWIDTGIGYAVDGEEVIWSVRVEPFAQDLEGWRPALILGTGSVQAGGSDQSGYVQLVKTLEVVEGRLGISVAGGYATDIPDLVEHWGLATFSVTLFDRMSPFYIYDGINSHIGISFFPAEWLTLSGYVLEMEEPAVSVGLQWCFDEGEEE